MRLGIIGGGVVGRSTARCYMEFAEVRVYDIVPERRTHSLEDVLATDIIMICLPTPQKDGMGLDTSVVDNFFSGVRPGPFGAYGDVEKHYDANFVLRSTVPVGTTRRLREQYGLLNLVHSPEFLTARCAMTDAQLPARNIVGDPDLARRDAEGREAITSNKCNFKLHELYTQRFPGIPIHCMTSDESEAVKLFQNGIFAATVGLWNELRTLADKLGLSWDAVRQAILADGRIGSSHTQVPGQDGQRGWGGACLPKDISQLLSHFHELDLPAKVLDGVWERNWEHDRPQQEKPITGTHRRDQP